MSKTCLLLMPFSDLNGGNNAYWTSLYAALERRINTTLPDYHCDRCNIGAGLILSNLLVRITAAHLIICDLTHMKPNVLFELGAAIMLGKPTILLAQGEPAMPADLNNYAFVKYSFEAPASLRFPANGKGDLFQQSLEFMTSRYKSDLFINTESTLAKTLKGISDTLKHAIQLEGENAILAPALRSLFDNLVSENAKELSQFLEQNKKSVTISIESPKILFDVLIALLNNLNHEDKYDSIAWRKHWMGRNRRDSQRFLNAILKTGYDLPQMRRIFLVGINALKKESWQVDEKDRAAVVTYYSEVRKLPDRVQSRVLFLPQRLVEHVANVCHMGRITKGATTLYVFSQYAEDGSLNSFKVVRDKNFEWEFDELWNLSTPMETLDWAIRPCTVPLQRVQFSGPANDLAYSPELERALKSLGVQSTNRLVR